MRPLSRICNGPAWNKKKAPPQAHTAVRGGENGSRKEGYRAAVVQTGLPSTEIDFKRVSIQGRSWLGRAA